MEARAEVEHSRSTECGLPAMRQSLDYPLSSAFGENKPLKARFWSRLEPFLKIV